MLVGGWNKEVKLAGVTEGCFPSGEGVELLIHQNNESISYASTLFNYCSSKAEERQRLRGVLYLDDNCREREEQPEPLLCETKRLGSGNIC